MSDGAMRDDDAEAGVGAAAAVVAALDTYRRECIGGTAVGEATVGGLAGATMTSRDDSGTPMYSNTVCGCCCCSSGVFACDGDEPAAAVDAYAESAAAIPMGPRLEMAAPPPAVATTDATPPGTGAAADTTAPPLPPPARRLLFPATLDHEKGCQRRGSGPRYSAGNFNLARWASSRCVGGAGGADDAAIPSDAVGAVPAAGTAASAAVEAAVASIAYVFFVADLTLRAV